MWPRAQVQGPRAKGRKKNLFLGPCHLALVPHTSIIDIFQFNFPSLLIFLLATRFTRHKADVRVTGCQFSPGDLPGEKEAIACGEGTI
ncbi:MAG: hypothetical protein D5R98_02860 [Desulfonatronovibrio sp. MSAO_Bac4]|nr:MAG: hypothetical protein D5R98_02860 [Desulfonatronovibrio sp. MSAO_Bac4]